MSPAGRLAKHANNNDFLDAVVPSHFPLRVNVARGNIQRESTSALVEAGSGKEVLDVRFLVV